jgi:RHS repeat-associated protein
MVVDANQKYSKHYFNGTQRVASKIGEQDITMFDTNNPYLKQANSKAAENTPSTDFDTLKNKQITDFSYYLSKSTNNATAKNVKVKYTEYKKVDTNTETTSAKAADNNSAYAAPQYAELYYYHSDHLGTGTFLSDFDGNPYQFFLNLPFGETMAEQHSYSGEYTNRYKFNGKELDEETGFYYYGARYYNPKFSIWLSVDPLAEKFPDWSPYNYCLNNPIRFIDPDGREVMNPGDRFKTIEAAAKDFAMLYNDNSIKDKKEYGAVIYQVTNSRGEKYYTYTVPNVSSGESSVIPAPDFSMENSIIVSAVHTHSNYDKKYANDVPSPKDMEGAELFGMDAYISTPKGELLKYNVNTNQTIILDKNIPSDKNHPNRSNKIDSDKLPKNEPTRGTGKIILDNIIVPLLQGAGSIKG